MVAKSVRKRGRPSKAALYDRMMQQEEFEQEGNAGQEWHTCMYFNDKSDVPEFCREPGENVATIEVPLSVVDITWRTGLAPIKTYLGTKVYPAAHPLERGCYTTMPLVLCEKHRKELACTVQCVK